MEYYERNIGFRTIYLTIVRRFKLILLIFLPILGVSLIVSFFVLPKTFQSSVTISKSSSIMSITNYETIQSYVKSTGTINKTAEQLKKESISHSNGNEITLDEIYSGITFAPLGTNSISVTFYFQSSDKGCTQSVLSVLANITVDALRNDPATSKEFSALSITTPPSVPHKNTSDTKIVLVSLFVGLVISFAASFVYEVYSDKIYNDKDLLFYGYNSEVLDVTKGG